MSLTAANQIAKKQKKINIYQHNANKKKKLILKNKYLIIE